MKNKLLIISGMPASGKDTVTNELIKKDDRFVALKKHRSVSEKDKIKDTYYNISPLEFESMILNNEFLQYHERYGRHYGISKKELQKVISESKIPIIHIGRIENYFNFLDGIKHSNINADIIHVQLWNDKSELKRRIIERDVVNEEIEARLAAMEQEFDDAKEIVSNYDNPFTVIVKNDSLSNTVNTIINVINGKEYNDGYNEYVEYLKLIE